jgi:TonB family protein
MTLKWFFILGMVISTTNLFGQTKDSVESNETIFIDPLIPPSFPGGQVALREYIGKNLNWTPGQLTVQGRVFVEFSVDVDGTIKDVKVVRGLCDSCDKEALRLVTTMPNWNAGIENGKTVKTRMVLPIKFGL